MEYITAKEAAEKWSISERRACRFFAGKAKIKEQIGLAGLGLFRGKLKSLQTGAKKHMMKLNKF